MLRRPSSNNNRGPATIFGVAPPPAEMTTVHPVTSMLAGRSSGMTGRRTVMLREEPMNKTLLIVAGLVGALLIGRYMTASSSGATGPHPVAEPGRFEGSRPVLRTTG